MSRSGLNEDEKPVGSFLFAGPTGVGKTEVTRQLALVMGVELIRFDMSEYMERHTVSRLIGAPPGYVGFDQGGLLTEAVSKNPHAVVLLDEIEKAHPEVFNLLLQVMDHGTLTDNNGRKADFRNIVLVMTTNAGAQEMSRASIGFTQQDHSTDGMAIIKKSFSPEFRNRLDAIIQFAPLDAHSIARVVDKLVVELESKLGSSNVTLELDAGARDWIADRGYDPKMGARPMARVIQEHIKRPLAEELLFGSLADGGHVRITVGDDGNLQLIAEPITAGIGAPAGRLAQSWRELALKFGPGLASAPVDNPALAQIVGRQLHGDVITRENADVVLPHLAGNVCSHDVTVFQLDPKSRVGERLGHDAFHLQGLFFSQFPVFSRLGQRAELCRNDTFHCNAPAANRRCQREYRTSWRLRSVNSLRV